jgi:hypothetical protein
MYVDPTFAMETTKRVDRSFEDAFRRSIDPAYAKQAEARDRQTSMAGMERAIPAAALAAASSTPADVRKIAAARVAEGKKPAQLNVTGGNNGGIGGKKVVSGGGDSTSVRASSSTSTADKDVSTDGAVTKAGQVTDYANVLDENLLKNFGVIEDNTPAPFRLTDDLYNQFVAARTAGRNFVPKTAEEKQYYSQMNNAIMNNSRYIDKEIERAQKVIADMQNAGQDVTAQNAYLKKLQDRKSALAVRPYLDTNLPQNAVGGSDNTVTDLAQRDLADYTRLADQQIADLTRQREADTKELNRQLQTIQEGLPAKSYQRMRQAFQNLANRGMLNSGLNMLSQNQETANYNQEMADAYSKFADKLSTLQKGYGEKEQRIAEDRAKKSLPYFIKERQDMLKAMQSGTDANATGLKDELDRAKILNSLIDASNKVSGNQGLVMNPLGQLQAGVKTGTPVLTAKEREAVSGRVEADEKLKASREKAAQSFSLASSKLASKNSMDRENMALKVHKLMNTLADSQYKRSIAPDKATLDSLNKQMFALQGAKTPEARDAILTKVAPQMNTVLKQMTDKANASNDPAALGLFSQYLK